MPKYRKKPIVVEAEQWFLGSRTLSPFLKRLLKRGSISGGPYVITIHARRAYLDDGDWVIAEDREGYAYPCKPDKFAKTYDLVEETT